jgi:competence protein ComEC
MGPLFLCEPALAFAWCTIALALVWQRISASVKWATGFALAVLTLQVVRAEQDAQRRSARQDELIASFRGLSRCAGQLAVSHSPTLSHGVFRVRGQTRDLDCGSQRYQGSVTLTLDAKDVRHELGRGDVLDIIAELGVPERFLREGSLPAATRPNEPELSGHVLAFETLEHGRSIAHAIDQLRHQSREDLQRDFGSKSEALARALVLGETDLSDEDKLAFSESGLLHLLAVSGMHLILVVGTAERLLRWLLVRVTLLSRTMDPARIAAIFSLVFALSYASFAGGSGSAFRAAWMVASASLARALCARSHARRNLTWSLLLFGLWDPWALFDLSFVLSAVATMALMTLGPRILPATDWLTGTTTFGKKVSVMLSSTLAATLGCFPVLAKLSGPVSSVTLLLNVLAIPLGELLALPLCLAHGFVAPWPTLSGFVARAAETSIALTLYVAKLAAYFPTYAMTPWHASQVAWVSAVALAMCLRQSARRRTLLALAAALSGYVLLQKAETEFDPCKGKLCVTFLDVGQGDAILLQFPHGGAALIDGGGIPGSSADTGKRVILPLLKQKRISSLLFVALSHPHPDHYSGLPSVLESVEVGELIDTGEGAARGTMGGYGALLAVAARRQIPVTSPSVHCGEWMHDGVRIEVLAPCKTYESGTFHENTNDNSLVMRLTFGARSILLTGDAEAEEERSLVGPRVRADVLKVGHHGSATSTSAEWLAAVQPQLAVISTGVRNRFGHPRKRTLDALDGCGAQTLRTDEQGTITVRTNGGSLDWFSWRTPEPVLVPQVRRIEGSSSPQHPRPLRCSSVR